MQVQIICCIASAEKWFFPPAELPGLSSGVGFRNITGAHLVEHRGCARAETEPDYIAGNKFIFIYCIIEVWVILL